MEAEHNHKVIISTKDGFKVLGSDKVHPKTVKGLLDLTKGIKKAQAKKLVEADRL